MIVVDVNTIAYLWIPGPLTEAAEQALQRDSAWAAPLLWRSEFRNILAGYLRRGSLSADAALRCVACAEEQMRDGEFFVPSASVLREVARSGCSAYDCEYVALAEDLDLRLVTCDRRVLKEFPKRAVDLAAFAAGR